MKLNILVVGGLILTAVVVLLSIILMSMHTPEPELLIARKPTALESRVAALEAAFKAHERACLWWMYEDIKEVK